MSVLKIPEFNEVLVAVYLPVPSAEEVRLAQQFLETLRQKHLITDLDYTRIVRAQNVIFRRRLQRDPGLRRRPANPAKESRYELFITREQRVAREGARRCLAIAHRLMDRYEVHDKDRRLFFANLTRLRYHIRLKALAELQWAEGQTSH